MDDDSPDLSLELSADRIREWTAQATRRIATFIETLPEQPSFLLEGAREAARRVNEPLPAGPTPFEEVMREFFEEHLPTGFNTAGPGYLAYIPGGGLYHAALADLIAGATNRYVGVWLAAPALAQIEVNVVRWFCRIVGYPQRSAGFLTTGGSLANFSAIVAARVDRLPEDFLAGTLYVSDQTHHSVAKAARLAGLPASSVRVIESDGHFRMRSDLLEEAVERDRRRGREPFLVVGSAGTTNTGAVDPLAELADFCGRSGLWFHVDAAYGGFFMLTERGQAAMAGIERSDSVVLDPHKGLFLPYGTGCLLVRDEPTLRRAHSSAADYLPPMQDDDDFIDFCEISPELSRDFRGLRIWLPFKLHGIGPFVRNLDEKLDLAEWAAGHLRQLPGIRLVAPPQLSTLAFRFEPASVDPERWNDLNRRLLKLINERRRVYLTETTVGGEFLLRISVVSFRTHKDRMEMAVEDIAASCREVLD